DDRGRDRRNHGLAEDCVGGNLVPVHPPELVGKAPFQARYEHEACERVVIHDGVGYENEHENERHPRAERVTDGYLHGLDYAVGGVVLGDRYDHHVGPGGPQVGDDHDQAAPEQVALDGLLALDLDTHVQGHLDAEERENDGREERPLPPSAQRRGVEGKGVDGVVPIGQPDEAGDPNYDKAEGVKHELDIYVVLSQP